MQSKQLPSCASFSKRENNSNTETENINYWLRFIQLFIWKLNSEKDRRRKSFIG